MAAGRPRVGFSTVDSTRPSRSSRPRWRRTPTELILSRSARRGADRRPWRRSSTRISSRVLRARALVVDMVPAFLPWTLWKQQCFLPRVYAGGERESKLATLVTRRHGHGGTAVQGRRRRAGHAVRRPRRPRRQGDRRPPPPP